MNSRNRPKFLLLILAYLAFVSLGLPDAVLGLAWPSLCRTFGVPEAALGMPLAATAVTYFVSGLFAGRWMQAAGVGSLLAVSTVLVAAAVAGYAVAPLFGLFLAAACLAGFGSGAVDAGLNTYAAEHFGARHMTWLHAAYSTGAALGSASMTVLFANGLGFRYGYATIAAALSALAVAFVLTRRLWSAERLPGIAEPPAATRSRPRSESQLGAWAALRNRRVILQASIFFVYSGVEVGAGQWSYTIMTQAREVDPKTAALYVTSYWASLLFGRVLAGFIVESVGTVRLLRIGSFVATLGAVLFATRALPAGGSCLALCLIGLAIAPIYPGLMSETPRRVGPTLAPHAVGFQVSAAIAGVAVLPNLGGLLGEWRGLNAIAAFIAVCALLLCGLHELLVRESKPADVSKPAP